MCELKTLSMIPNIHNLALYTFSIVLLSSTPLSQVFVLGFETGSPAVHTVPQLPIQQKLALNLLPRTGITDPPLSHTALSWEPLRHVTLRNLLLVWMHGQNVEKQGGGQRQEALWVRGQPWLQRETLPQTKPNTNKNVKQKYFQRLSNESTGTEFAGSIFFRWTDSPLICNTKKEKKRKVYLRRYRYRHTQINNSLPSVQPTEVWPSLVNAPSSASETHIEWVYW